MSRSKVWVIVGLMVAVLAGVLVFVLQSSGIISDPQQLVCDAAVRRGDCD